MKCENCGKNEVTFVYRSNVNGHVEEKHLCSDCAEKLGYTQRLGAQSQRMMQASSGTASLETISSTISSLHAQPAGAENEDAEDPLTTSSPRCRP
ncbi:MAG: hypothetical protein ACLUHL_00720 [Dysosmobacter welbionis]